GEIKEVKKHPNSNKLNICEVFFKNKLHTIICGAKNVKPKLKVIVAQVGTKMLDGRIIEAKELLGVKSNGMICAYSELTSRIEYCGTEEIDNIIELDNSAKIDDENPLKYVGMDDEIFDLSVPSNRNDLNGVLAIAYDLISVYFPNVKLDYSLKNLDKVKKNNFKITIDKNVCSFFSAISVKNVVIKPSSWKVKSWLLNSGITPINNIVDLTNLNTIITSSPSHGYDKDTLNNELSVFLNKEKTKVIPLNKKEYTLEKNETVCVMSKNEVTSLAGIIGIEKYSISSNTKNVVFEVANFDNLLVRKTADKFNIKTDASVLSSKKIPLWITYKSTDFLISLLIENKFEIDGINLVGLKPKQISIDYDEKIIMELLGASFPKGEITKTLKLMGFKIDGSKITVPVYREDLETIYDIVEELAKKIDVNKLPGSPILDSIIDFNFDYFEENRVFLQKYFINKGFSLVKSFNLTSSDNNKKFNLFKVKNPIKIINPISKEREFFRNNLIQQHLEIISNNYARKNSMINIFEIQGLSYDNSWNQHLCLTLSADLFNNKINNSKIKVDFLLLKSILTDLLNLYGVDYNFDLIKNINPDVSFVLINNGFEIFINKKSVGFAGQINPDVLNDFKISSELPVYFFEIIINELVDKKMYKSVFVAEEKKSHNITRFLTLIISKEDSYKKYDSIFKHYLNVLKKINSYNVESVFMKDENISYTFAFDINEKALTKIENSEINEIFEAMIKDFENAGAEIRR
ncbi:MAG: phenylalanine--tRNA ligase subunit beta, partial [Malacoplasma sp.]|nr:phenylalanine--tRNA ligase subunit beta [Malacoplasma sp.]